jgi:hypothetical protein
MSSDFPASVARSVRVRDPAASLLVSRHPDRVHGGGGRRASIIDAEIT